MLSPTAIALERLLVRRRELSSTLLDAEMFDRWGPKEGPERDRVLAEAGAAREAYDAVRESLTTLSRETWARDPAAVRAWAEAHVDLLERFIARTAGDAQYDTARYVAREEIIAWREVASGARPFVEENVYYVPVEREHHATYFGAMA